MKEASSYNQINDQINSAYMNRGGDKPTVLIKRNDGRVTAGKLDQDTQDVDFQEDGVNRAHEAVPLAELSDQRQAELAEELAGKPLRDNEIVKAPEHQQVTRDLGSEAIRGVRHESDNSSSKASQLQNSYDNALEEKKRAQREDRGEDSIYWGQVAGQYAREYQGLTGRNIQYRGLSVK